jgi:molybdate transport system substrate-binding protein
MSAIRAFCVSVMAALLACSPTLAAERQTGRVTVLAAASLTDAMQQIGRSYEAANGSRIVFSFAASMTLAKQIEASAGADVFVSADMESMDYLDNKGLIAKRTRQNLLGNSLVLVAPMESKLTLAIAPGFKLAEALQGGRLALANVDSVPAGRYGKAALTALRVWDGVAGRLAQGEDVRATLAYVARGEAPLGIVYATDARAEPRVRTVATFPANTHPPIVYPAALVKDANPTASAFLAYLKGPQARAIFERVGFTVLARP